MKLYCNKCGYLYEGDPDLPRICTVCSRISTVPSGLRMKFGQGSAPAGWTDQSDDHHPTEKTCKICGYLFEADSDYPLVCRDCSKMSTSHAHEDPGKKFDQDKLRVDLVPVEGIEATARVLTFGAKKYGDRNWELGMKHSRLYGAVLRHLLAHWRGETYDQETGYPHLHHAVCACMMLQTLFDRGHGTDDRPLEGNDA